MVLYDNLIRNKVKYFNISDWSAAMAIKSHVQFVIKSIVDFNYNDQVCIKTIQMQ